MEDTINIIANLNTKGFEKGSQAIKRAVNSLNRSAQQLGRGFERSTRMAISSVKRLIPMIIGVGSAYGIISKAVSAFMSQNEELSSKMNSIWTALGNVLAPIITQIIEWVTTAVSYFLEFLRLLGITNKTASELSRKANKNNQELQKTITGFDELNVLSDNSQQNKEKNLDDVSPSEWMKKLADLLKNKMWDDAADLIIKKMNEIIYTIRDKAYEVGEKVGEYLRGIIHVIARVLDETDWKQLGVAFANFFNGLVPEDEAFNFGQDLGKILVSGFTIGFKIVTGFLEDPGWPNRIADILSGIVVGALTSITNAIRGADFKQIGENVRAFFERLWEHKDEIAQAIYDALKAAWDSAFDLLQGIFGEDSPLSKSLGKIKEAIEKLGETCIPILENFANALRPLFDTVVNDVLPEFFSDLAKAISDLADVLSGKMKFGEFLTHMNGLETVLLGIAGIKLGGIIGDLGTFASTIGTKVMGAFLGGGGAAGGAAGAAGKAAAAATGGGGLVGTLEAAATKIFDFGAELSGVEGPAGAFGTHIANLGIGLSDFAAGLGVVVEGLGVGGLLGVVATVGAGIVAVIQEIDTISKVGYAEAGLSAEEYAENVRHMQEEISKAKDNFDMLASCGGDLTMAQNELDHATIGYNNALEQLAGSMGMTLSQFKDQLDAYDGNLDKMLELKDSNDQLIQTMSEEGKTIQEIADALQLSSDYVSTQVDKNVELANATTETAKAGDELVETTNDLSEASGTATGASKDLNAENARTERSFSGLQKVVSDSSDKMRTDFAEGMTEMGQTASEQTQDMNDVFDTNFGIIADNAYYWGWDMIANVNNGIVDGVNSMLEPTMIDIANLVRSYIGFSEPEKGPLSNFHTYGPDMMKLFAEGITGTSGKVMKAVSAVAEGVSEAINGGDYTVGANFAAMNAIGANVPFAMPAVAGGGILPYSVSGSVAGGQPTQGEEFILSATQQLVSAIQDLQSSLENMQWVAQFGNVRAIVQEITRIQRNIAKSEGK